MAHIYILQLRLWPVFIDANIFIVKYKSTLAGRISQMIRHKTRTLLPSN